LTIYLYRKVVHENEEPIEVMLRTLVTPPQPGF